MIFNYPPSPPFSKGGMGDITIFNGEDSECLGVHWERLQERGFRKSIAPVNGTHDTEKLLPVRWGDSPA